jgi:hypothetical protein
MQTTIPHDQHMGLQGAQHAHSPHSLTDTTGPESGIDDGMGTTLNQIDTLDL